MATASSLTPHTLRLLTVLCDGTQEQAYAACSQLQSIAASSSPVQLWDLLGRLQSFLGNVKWRTRRHAAQALEAVAAELPTSDQRGFLMRENGDTTAISKHHLTVDSIETSLENILTGGQQLWSHTEDKSNDSNGSGEDRALQSLDDLAIRTKDQSLLESRVRLQRGILAQRLGLSGINAIVGGATDEVLSETLTAQDIAPDDVGVREGPSKLRPGVVSSSASEDDQVSRKRRKHANRIRKRNEDQKRGNEDGDDPVHMLLVREMKYASADGPAASHRNPQTLLATELIYRLFHSKWHVRHGSLLGSLSLLRAWKRTAAAATNDSSRPLFGAWPHDLLARCVCVLILDRFGDFSGAIIPTGSQEERSYNTGGVVAPVREAAGQLLSILFAMAPDAIQEATLRLLFGLLERAHATISWEVRHGALVALKFVTVVLSTDCFSGEKIHKSTDRVEAIARHVTAHLADPSDDVRAATAQVLAEYVQRIKTPCSLNRDLTIPLTVAMERASTVSSCIHDLVVLFARLIDRDHEGLLRHVSTERIIALQLRLLASQFASVRLAVLKSLQVLAQPMTRAAAKSLSQKHSIEPYFRLMNNVFGGYLGQQFTCCDADTIPETAMRDLAWAKLVEALQATPLSLGALETLESNLIAQYFTLRSENCFLVGSVAHLAQAANALSLFILTSRKQTMSSVVLVAVNSFLQSPWVSLCEAALLFIRYLASRLPIPTALRDSIHQMLNHVPLCLQVGYGSAVEAVLGGEALAQVCQEAWNTGISRLRRDDALSWLGSSGAIREVWRRETLSRLPVDGQHVSPVTSMRIQATIAGCALSVGLPSKLTPLIRPLMTSVRNEVGTCTRSQLVRGEWIRDCRQFMTCQYLADLLLAIAGNKELEKASRKVILSICEMAIQEMSFESTECQTFPASTVLRLLFVDRGGLELHAVPPVWECLTVLRSADPPKEQLLRAIFLMRAITESIGASRSCSPLLLSCREFVQPMVCIFCQSAEERTRLSCGPAIAGLTQADTDNLQLALSALIPFLESTCSARCRQQAGTLLELVVTSAGVSACPFVRGLLPVAMAMMTDADPECSKLGNRIFATLVRLAPLSQRQGSVLLKSHDQREGDAVIDHLILGLPLPRPALPAQIQNCLLKSGIRLRDYQLDGIAWLRFLQSMRLNGALCDSMGLGKTIQALIGVALAQSDWELATSATLPKSLVVCPATLVGHWVAEISKFFPDLAIFRPLALIGGGDARRRLWSDSAPHYNIVVCSYAVLRNDIDTFSDIDFLYCVLDEGHLLRNPRTETSKASRRISARHKLILTGTPVQNRTEDLWAAFDFLMPNFLGSSAMFASQFARPIAKGQLPGACASSISDSIEKLRVLHQQVLPFILRRDKEKVLQELPEKIVSVVYAPMSHKQEKLYGMFCSGATARSALLELKKALNRNDDGLAFGSEVLKSLFFLRLLCTHPSLVEANGEAASAPSSGLIESGKLLVLLDLLRSAGIGHDRLVAADNDMSLLYCQDDAAGGHRDSPYGSVVDSARGIGLSADFDSTKPALNKCIIFAQFRKSLDVVEELVLKPHLQTLRYLRLDSNTPTEKRTRIADQFNTNPSIQLLLSTSRVGGLGLNLTGADTAIFLESDLNPFSDLQAGDRIHRIGQQSKVVNIYKLVTKDSIEENIVALQEKKTTLSKSIVNTDNSTLYSMGTDRLLDIFSFRSRENDASQDDEAFSCDLDALADKFRDDYESLSVEDFLVRLDYAGEGRCRV